jgi:hypothetical protein
MNMETIYKDDIHSNIGFCEQPMVLYQFTVKRSGGRDSLSVIGDRAFVEDGGLVILRDCTAVAAFPPGQWEEMTSDAILPVQSNRKECYRGPIRECAEGEYAEDYCDE